MGLSDPDGVWKWVDGSDYETNIKWVPWLSVPFSSFSSAPPGSDPQPLLPSLDSVPSVLPSWLFSSHHPRPPPQELEARPAGWLSWAWAGWGWGLCPFLPQWWVEWRCLPKTLLLDLRGWTEQRQLREWPPAWEMAGWGRETLFLVGEQ